MSARGGIDTSAIDAVCKARRACAGPKSVRREMAVELEMAGWKLPSVAARSRLVPPNIGQFPTETAAVVKNDPPESGTTSAELAASWHPSQGKANRRR